MSDEAELEEFDILHHFKTEAFTLFAELEDLVEDLEEHDEYPIEQLEEYAQKIDRIMGSAQTIHENDAEIPFVDSIAMICQLCKKIGYSAKNNPNPGLLPIYSAFLTDCLEVLEELTEHIDQPEKLQDQTAYFSRTLQKRLEWLLEKLKQQGGEESKIVDQSEVDALLASLGIG